MEKLEVNYDPFTDILTIDGVCYSGHYFRAFKAPENILYAIQNKDGVVWLKEIRTAKDAASFFEEANDGI